MTFVVLGWLLRKCEECCITSFGNYDDELDQVCRWNGNQYTIGDKFILTVYGMME